MAPARVRRATATTPLLVLLAGPLTADEVAELCREVQAELGPAGLVCRVEPEVDLGVVDALARLQLMTQRLSGALRVLADEDPRRELAELLAQVGLSSAVPASESFG